MPDPHLYTERYHIPIGRTAALDMSITLDTSVADADVIGEIDDGAGGWTEIDSTTGNFSAGKPITLATIFGGYIIWTAALPEGVRQFRVRVSGGTPTTTEIIFYTSFDVYISPTISSSAISDSSIAQDERTTISCITDGDSGWVDLLDADGAVVYSKDLAITAGAGSVTIAGRYLAVGTYAAGQLVIHVVDNSGTLAAKDATLALEVTASSSSYQMQVAQALQDVLQADSRLASITDGTS